MIIKFNFKILSGSLLLLLSILFFSSVSYSQYNSTWLLGYQGKAKMTFNDTSYSISPEIRKMPFWYTQGNISDSAGNFLMSSNGIFIANATGDTMQNGSGLNPNQFTTDNAVYGLPLPNGNIILPMPNDTSKYILIHQTGDYAAPLTLASTEIYFSIIDITLNSGLGAIISKNNIVITGSFGWGLSACKHGNGRDWWIFALDDSAATAYKMLLTPDTIQYIGSQHLQVAGHVGFAGQPTFSPDGEKFAYISGDGFTGPWLMDAHLFSFDRCSGIFLLDTLIQYMDGTPGEGLAFSPNSKYLYFSTNQRIYQIDTDTSDIGATFQLIATNDTFVSPVHPFYTNFFLMYLAANGKIYVSSGGSVHHLHEMNYPDSAGLACSFQLHNINTNCFSSGVPTHPNYYLGRKIGSPCDSLTSITEIELDFKFSISPNPTTGSFKIIYLLPQNQKGKFQIFDINGKTVYTQNLPQWSTLQNINCGFLSNGVYNAVLTSTGERVSRKLVLIK